MTIACAFRRRVASVGIILYLAWLTLYEITFQVRDMYWWTTLIRGRNCETPRKSNFSKKGKIVILVKIRNFSKSQMTKRTSPLQSSSKI